MKLKFLYLKQEQEKYLQTSIFSIGFWYANCNMYYNTHIFSAYYINIFFSFAMKDSYRVQTGKTF